MARIQRVDKGIYFLHKSFLKEMSDTWLQKGEISGSADLLHEIVGLGEECNIISCNRTMAWVDSSSKTRIGIPTALYNLVNFKSIAGDGDSELEDNEYSLKVASKNKIGPKPAYFIVAMAEKTRLIKLAGQKGYSLRILCREDFELNNIQ